MNGYVRAYEGDEPYIFVSYAHKDSGKVLPVIRALYDRKYRVWYDEGIAPGSEWPHNIERHLKNASAVIVFISENSILSRNCDNEVDTSIDSDKDIIQISLDSVSRHKLLQKEALKFDENLINVLTNGDVLGEELIGGGITGYQYTIDKKRSFNIWNLMLGLAAVLIVVLPVSLYGLYNGWFDDLLPARQPVAEVAMPTASPPEVISIDSNIIGSVLPVGFSSKEEKNAVYNILGWTQPSEMTYNDLIDMEGLTHLEIGDEQITDLGFAAFLPNLEEISLYNSSINDLSPLIECPKLNTVRVTANMLPIALPEVRAFDVEVM